MVFKDLTEIKAENFRLCNEVFVEIAVFATRNDPAAEVISVQVTRLIDDNWVTDAMIAVYRSAEGHYSQLPDR